MPSTHFLQVASRALFTPLLHCYTWWIWLACCHAFDFFKKMPIMLLTCDFSLQGKLHFILVVLSTCKHQNIDPLVLAVAMKPTFTYNCSPGMFESNLALWPTFFCFVLHIAQSLQTFHSPNTFYSWYLLESLTDLKYFLSEILSFINKQQWNVQAKYIQN